jgi:hypothetical protein
MRYFLIISLTLLGCHKRDISHDKPKPVESGALKISENNERTRNYPDSLTFFPLLPGSYWVYETFLEGEKQAESRVVDSVTHLTTTDSGYLIDVLARKQNGETKAIQYWVDVNGMVWVKRGKSQRFKVFASLFPKVGGKVDDRLYYPCPNSDLSRDCFLLQPYEGDKAGISDSQAQEWSGQFYRKGVGLESRAGAGQVVRRENSTDSDE